MQYQVFRYVNVNDVEFIAQVRSKDSFEPNQEVYLNGELYVVSHAIRRFVPLNGAAAPQEELVGLVMVKTASHNKAKYLRNVLKVIKAKYAQTFGMLGVE